MVDASASELILNDDWSACTVNLGYLKVQLSSLQVRRYEPPLLYWTNDKKKAGKKLYAPQV